MDNEKLFSMNLSKIYPLLVSKAERKGRTREEVDTVTCWLTGYTRDSLYNMINSDITYKDFFENAPAFNRNASLITGTVCGVKLSEIKNPLMLKIRYLDKLIDELAKGKTLDKILRK